MNEPKIRKCLECSGTGLFPKKNDDGTYGESEGCSYCQGTGQAPPQSDAGAEWPKEKDLDNRCHTLLCNANGRCSECQYEGYNEARSECLAVHQKLMSEKEAEIYKIKDNLVRMITGECSKNHKPTFEEISELGCAICNKAEIARLKEKVSALKKATGMVGEKFLSMHKMERDLFCENEEQRKEIVRYREALIEIDKDYETLKRLRDITTVALKKGE